MEDDEFDDFEDLPKNTLKKPIKPNFSKPKGPKTFKQLKKK